MAVGEKMFVAPPNSFQLGDKELEVGGEGVQLTPRNGYAVSRGRRSEDQSAFSRSADCLKSENNHVFLILTGEGADAGRQTG